MEYGIRNRFGLVVDFVVSGKNFGLIVQSLVNTYTIQYSQIAFHLKVVVEEAVDVHYKACIFYIYER